MKKYCKNENVVCENTNEDAILINMESCKILRINFEGQSIWSLLDQYDNAVNILGELQNKYSEIKCSLDDIESFLRVLLEKGMLNEKI